METINQRGLLQAQYGISNVLGIGLELPFIRRYHSHIESNHLEQFNINGLGDMTVSGEYSILLPSSEFAPYLSFQAGVKLPTGVTDVKNASGESAEVTIQPGTGSFQVGTGLLRVGTGLL